MRQERVAETRARIVEAVVALHEELGPRATTIKAIAERAGVERLTVYRHFPDDRSLFQACSSCWLEANPPPDRGLLAGEPAGEERIRKGLLAICRYYRAGQGMLSQVYRDIDEIPALAEVMTGFTGYLESLAGVLLEGCPGREQAGWRLENTVGHVLHYRCWEMLEQAGVSDSRKVALPMSWIREELAGES